MVTMEPNTRHRPKAYRPGPVRSGMVFLAAAAATVLAVALPARACTIPVFRYAMERWPPDIYEILVFHKGPLSAPDRKTVDWMKKTANSEESLANCAIRTVDLSGKLSEGVKALWQAQASAKPPWMVVMFPRYSRAAGMRPAWSVPFWNALTRQTVCPSG